jgi:hypothetical protein
MCNERPLFESGNTSWPIPSTADAAPSSSGKLPDEEEGRGTESAAYGADFDMR